MHIINNNAVDLTTKKMGEDKENILSLTQIQYAQDFKFIKPSEKTYSVVSSVLSIASLVLMTVASTWMYLYMINPNTLIGVYTSKAIWAQLPFLFTIFGAGLGALFELYLLFTGTPFQQTRSKATTFIKNIRLLNLAPVALTIFYAVCCMVIADPQLRTVALYFSGFVGFGLGFALFFSGAPIAVFATLVGLQVMQIVLVLTNYSSIGSSLVPLLLIGQAVLQTIAFFISAQTPLKSTGFHVTSTTSGALLFAAIYVLTTNTHGFADSVTIDFAGNSLLLLGFVVTCLAGIFVTCRCFPRCYNNWRTSFSNRVWSVIYFALVSAKRFPKPYNLSKVYANTKPQATKLRPYYVQHPEFLPIGLNIPSVENIEGNVNIFHQLVTRARKIFSVIAIFDHFLPQSNIKTPIDQKPRMEVWSDGTNYWPSLFTKTIFGYSIPGKKLAKAPETAVKTYKEGQLLAYLAESGVASPLLQEAPSSHPGMLMINFRHLEKYETKSDYQSYGGIAYFKINKTVRKLELVSVVAPHSNQEITADPDDFVFRQAEQLIIASMYFQIISGKHLSEIHMTYNLVEVSLHNAFDVNRQWNHPIRTMLYLHLFSHELAEEITTEHLIQKGAVFSQIFATKYDSLIHHLNDCYANFEYGADEDFEKRVKLLSLNNDSNSKVLDVLPNACIKWELEYEKIWRRYAEKVVNAVYANDSDVVNDEYLQCFYQNLLQVVVKGLPERYQEFKTKKGLTRYLIDTIHHLVIRHQVYGTTAIRAAMDPRISKVQVPKDMGTSAVDEWRTLAYVALATGKARFTLLMDDFTYLLEGVDSRYQVAMREAFNTLQEDLKALDNKWTSSPEDKEFNEEYFRALPTSLHTGPGY